MKKLEVRLAQGPANELYVGTLAEEHHEVFFEYADEFLRTNLNLSPLRLPFQRGLFVHRDREFGPLPGLFDDSLPDGWGLLLMDRHFRTLGKDPGGISPLDRLSWLGTRTMGALTYHPPAAPEHVDGLLFDLHDLARNAQETLAGAPSEILPQLLRAGGSPAGARPKVLIGYNASTGKVISGAEDLPAEFEHWIVKFPARVDSVDAGAIELAYSLMARVAGIEMSPTRLFETPQGGRFFGIQRFDRRGSRRVHMHTFGNLIQTNFRVPSADYEDLMKATSVLTRNYADVKAVFRRMVFNVAAHNRDDHVKNFAFLLDGGSGEWRISPAYDLGFSDGPGGEHTMSIAGEGRAPSRAHMLRVAEHASISAREAGTIIEEVLAATARWDAFAREAGVSKAAAAEIARALCRL